MGAVDLVIQVESPRSVASGLQRIGRAGHQVGEASKGKIFPKHRSDLVEAAVVAKQMQDGSIEHTRYPRNPLDVLAQQIVAMSALDDWPVAKLREVIARSANFHELSDEVFTTCSICCRVGTRPRRSPSCGRAWSGIGSKTSSVVALEHNGSPSPAAAPSPIEVCSACSCPTAPGWASSTRRWSTRVGRGDLPPWGEHVAHRGDHLRTGGRHTRPR